MPALNELTIQIPNGISGFVGKNGSGKTTTIGVLLGLIKANKGQASMFGLDCWKNSFEIRQKLGVMHETNAYPGNFSARRFLTHVAKLYGITQIDQTITQLLKDVDLTHAQDKPIKTFSAGMFKRLGLAQALIGNPELAILDEPTANIDPLGRITILEKIKDMHTKHGTSFLISTHILSDLEKICNYLIIIDQGKTIDQGNINTLTEKYSANIYKIEVSNPPQFITALQKTDTIDKVWVENDKIFCKVNNPEMFCAEIPKIASELKLQLKGFQQTLNSLEEIYSQTVGEKR
ncbi:MAG: ABC transporter ATP-binding protein [Candidatus Bathyarchaeota archaeon]|uniref:ABC transporter ATP-binding protein n=1 Tax=Candidatus Bathycorpusculum sp. TaxID=2994959 RepID=UPI002816D804|nr:ABC transporter ATP-binding protein [Candidatus Termiticorpusculum sp.]MCL2257984.1 ABC transporter ATP-binding protein [Candidatus Termiticorpusculum sp.]MCL2291829.1 ABC transporter ATP-binding protein [Candidatus Termiticorpusculum sp.]